MFSYWEQQSFTQYDYIIAGAGIVGLNTAIELKERKPQASVLVLERGLLPTGASTRNAGFACMGSVTELLDDLQMMSEKEVCTLFDRRKKGLERLRSRLGDGNIGYTADGSFELIPGSGADATESIGYLNGLLYPVLQQKAFSLANEKIQQFGFSTDYTEALIENHCEGGLHTGKMMRALVDYAIYKGVEIKTGAEIDNFREETDSISVTVSDPCRKVLWILSGSALILCTNAFTKKLLPYAEVTPGRGQVLVTEPVEGLKFKGVFHFDKGYYYFREIDGRVLIGGGRNLDFEGEAVTDMELNDFIQTDLEHKLRNIIMPGIPFSVAQRWSGIMAFGQDKRPVVQPFSDRVFGAFRMGGMGVALGSDVAVQVADLVIRSGK